MSRHLGIGLKSDFSMSQLNGHDCLFVWSLSSHSNIFHSYGDVIAGEGLQLLTYARHSWPLSSEGSAPWHTQCDTGLTFIPYDHFRRLVTLTPNAERLAVELSLHVPVFTT